MPNENIDIRVRMRNARAAAAEARGVGGAVGGIGKKAKETEKHTRGMGRGFVYARKSIGPLRAGVTGLVGALGFGAGYGLIGAFKKSISVASDINESLTKNEVLFGRNAKGVERFSDKSAVAFGISKAAALEYTGVFGNLFHALGVSDKRSAGLSTGLTKLAADMASFNNTSIDEALEAIRSGLVGETEPLRKFGVNLNDATLRQQALSMGLTKSTKTVLTPYQKAMASQALIVKQTAAAHGDFHRTSKGLANQQRILSAEVSDLEGKFGKLLLPVMLKGTRALTKFVDEAERGKGEGGKFVTTVKDIWSNVKPAVFWFGRAAKNTAKFTAKHPGLAKMAAAAFLGYRAFKLLGGVKLVKLVGWIIKLRKAGKAANVAEAVAANLGTMPSKSTGPLGKFRGFFKGRMGLIGKVAGAAAVASFIAQLTGLEDADPFLFLHPPNTSEPKGWHHYMHKPGGPGSRKRYPDLKYNSRGDAIGNRIPRSQRRRDPHGAPGASVRPRVRVAEPAMPGGGPPELPGLQVFIDGRETARSTARWTDADRNRR